MAENPNPFSAEGNKLRCPDHCAVPPGSELWLLLLAYLILIKDVLCQVQDSSVQSLVLWRSGGILVFS